MEKEKKAVFQPKIDRCPECNSQNLVHDYDSGETVCGDCGFVIREQMMNRGPEWRAYTEEEKATRTRVGMSETYSVHDKGLSTDVGGGPFGVNYDAFGRKLPQETRLQMRRLRKWQIRSRVHTSVERNLAQAMNELNRLSDKLAIPSKVKEKTAIIYRKTVEKGMTRGRSIIAMITAALLVACRITGTQRTIREIANASLMVDKKEISRCYSFLLREFEMQMPITDPIVCISKIANQAGISGKTQGLAIEILNQAKNKRILSGKAPMGLAAAALYCACLQNNERKTQKELADVARVTEVTIRNRYKELKRKLSLNLPEEKSNRKNFRRARQFALFFIVFIKNRLEQTK